MGTLTRDQILGANDLAPVRVRVKQWGGDVYLRPMSGAERDELEEAGRTGTKGIRAMLVERLACDEAGNPIFAKGDAALLDGKSGAVLDFLFGRIVKLNKISDEEIELLEKD